MRVVFMGSPDFAAVCLERLLESDNEVVGVVSQPDKPHKKISKLIPTAVKKLAVEKNIEVETPEKIKNGELLPFLEKTRPDCIVVVAYGKILPKYVLDFPKYGCVNIHGSLLPKYRGAAPIQFALLNGEKKTGITSMLMDEGLDTGDMLLKTEVEISDDDNFETLHDKMAAAGAENLVKTLSGLEKGEIKPEKQTGDSCYASLIDKEMRKIDFSAATEEIYNKIRAFSPVPTAFTTISGSIVKVYKAKRENGSFSGKPGDVVSETQLIVKTSDGAIRLCEIAPEGKRRMDDEAFLRGLRDKKGLACN